MGHAEVKAPLQAMSSGGGMHKALATMLGYRYWQGHHTAHREEMFRRTIVVAAAT
jgi:hypothetical protein